ncbi:MAG: hypothetical protein NUW01_18475 [Gemmatimonadaceae bacterium]|nr:hypothetical protein [Gemmatimonadaceae bacterium]
MTEGDDRLYETLANVKKGPAMLAKRDPWYRNGTGLALYRTAIFFGMTAATVMLGIVINSVWKAEGAIIGVSGRIDGVVSTVAIHKERLDDHETRIRFVERRDR